MITPSPAMMGGALLNSLYNNSKDQGLIRDRAKCFEGLDGFFNKFDVMPQIISEYFTT